MSAKTGIEWTDATWNPVVGCTKVSAGCDHCYAERIVNRFAGKTAAYPERFDTVVLHPDRIDLPLRWRKPRMIFVNSMSDLFHADVPDEYIAEVFAVMAVAPQHTFQILTKRHARMRALLSSPDFRPAVAGAAGHLMEDGDGWHDAVLFGSRWPLPNVWLGVSVEDQQWADIRIPSLLDTPAAVRFLSCEPLLGPVDLSAWLGPVDWPLCWDEHPPGEECGRCIQPEWVIAGGESGPGARPMHPEWVRSLRDQCVAAGVPFHFKQWGEWAPKDIVPRGVDPSDPRQVTKRVGKRVAGRELDGRTWDEWPEGVR